MTSFRFFIMHNNIWVLIANLNFSFLLLSFLLSPLNMFQIVDATIVLNLVSIKWHLLKTFKEVTFFSFFSSLIGFVYKTMKFKDPERPKRITIKTGSPHSFLVLASREVGLFC